MFSNPGSENNSKTSALYSVSFSCNTAFGVYVFHFVIAMLSVIAKKLSPGASNDSVTKLIKDAFSFVSNNFEFRSNSTYVSLFLQFYTTFLSIKMDFDLSDIEIIKNNVDSLFNNEELTIFPPMAIDAVIKLSYFVKDVNNYATSVFNSYLNKNESYESYFISEKAALLSLSLNRKIQQQQQVSQPPLKQTKSKKQDKINSSPSGSLQTPLAKSSSSSVEFKNSDGRSTLKSAASSATNKEQISVDPLKCLVFGKSFFAAFCAFAVIQNQCNSEATYQGFIGKFTKRHEKAFITYFDRAIKPFSVLFALMDECKDKPPKILSSYVNSFHDLLLVNHSEKKYNVF